MNYDIFCMENFYSISPLHKEKINRFYTSSMITKYNYR